MTMKPQAVGSDDFRDLILYNNLFVDKSLFIKEVLDDSGKIVLITRPRRWGKTLNMDMLRRFLEIEIDEQGNPLPEEERINKKLFCGGEVLTEVEEIKKLNPLKISKYPGSLERQGKFPVVFITFKSVDGEDYQSIEDRSKEQICTLFRQHSYLAISDKIETFEQEDVKKYLDKNVNTVDLERSLSFLTGLLYKHYRKKPWVLVDEYDAPINNAYRNFGDNEGEFKKVISLFKGMMVSALKKDTGDPDIPVHKAVITGILRIAKAELFSSLNNVSEYSILEDNFSEHYGFLQEEVEQLLRQVKITKSTPEDIKNWYNGYRFGNKLVYNPYSIMQCLARDGKLDNHWLESGGLKLLDKVLFTDKIQEGLQQLVEGECLHKRVYKQISLVEVEEDSNALYSLLLFAGYLNAELEDFDDQRYKLSIPNQEVKQTYIEKIQKWAARKLKIDIGDYDDFVLLLARQELDKFKEKFSEYLLNSTSYHDLSKEKDYHNLMGGILAPLVRKYRIESNKESGLGRFDHMLVPIEGKGDTAIIIEYKILKSKEARGNQASIVNQADKVSSTSDKANNTLSDLASEALAQVDAGQYYVKAKSFAYVKKIAKIGIAFSGKEMDMEYKVENAQGLQ